MKAFVLRRKSRFRQIALVDSERGTIVRASAIMDTPRINGLFEDLDRSFVGLYRQTDDLILRIDDELWVVDDSVAIAARRSPTECQLTIKERGAARTTISYSTPMPDDLLAEETFQNVYDYDFGAWVARIASSPPHQAVLRTTWHDEPYSETAISQFVSTSS